MPSLAQIDARRRSYPIYDRARIVVKRLSAAIDASQSDTHRLRTLRGYVRQAIRYYNAHEMAQFLALYGPAFEFAIGSNDAAIDALALLEVAEINAEAMVQSVVGMAA